MARCIHIKSYHWMTFGRKKKYRKVFFYKTLCSRGCFKVMFVIHYLTRRVILFLKIFKTSSLQNRMSYGGEIVIEGSPPPTYQMSRVTCHVSHVTCHPPYFFFFFFLYKVVKLIDGGSVINGTSPSS